jgi:hypothetical protein
MFNVSPLTQMKLPIAQIAYYLNNQVVLMDLSMIQHVKFYNSFDLKEFNKDNSLLIQMHNLWRMPK